jgi:hypothetical protein
MVRVVLTLQDLDYQICPWVTCWYVCTALPLTLVAQLHFGKAI